MFLDNFHKIINETDSFIFTLYVSDKKECKSMAKGNGPASKEEVIASGASKSMDSALAKILLPEPTFIHNLLNNKMCNSYKCFCCEVKGMSQYMGHIDPINSWECLMTSIGNPEYVVITQIRKITEDE